ncbi:MAG: amidohydrolase family protein, partial [Dehalococcoidia bacterium]|nr:amidohydrolase family protein [Dehalococcoidia bacterium]
MRQLSTSGAAAGRTARKMIIDAHAHLFDAGYFPPAWHDRTAQRWAKAVYPPRDPADIRPNIERGFVDKDGSILMAELDRAGIDAAVCLTLDWALVVDDLSGVSPAEMMQHYAKIAEMYPGRFYAFAGIDPRRPDGLEVYERSVREWGMRGLKLYPPCGYFPYDDVCLPFYEKSLELGVPVVIHTAMVSWPMNGRFAHPTGVADVQSRYPDLEIIFAHSGYPLWAEEAIHTAAGHPNS